MGRGPSIENRKNAEDARRGQDGWEPLADYALAWATHQVSRAT